MEKLDYGLILHEVDCVNNTVKGISMVEYNEDDEILDKYDFQDPETTHILPRSKGEVLLNKICPKEFHESFKTWLIKSNGDFNKNEEFK